MDLQVDSSKISWLDDDFALGTQLLGTQGSQPALFAVDVPADDRHHGFGVSVEAYVAQHLLPQAAVLLAKLSDS